MEVAKAWVADEAFRMRQRITREQKGVALEFTQQLKEINPDSVNGTKIRSQVNNLLELLNEHDRLAEERKAI